jgi:two-component system chemotaxis response regulator CheY
MVILVVDDSQVRCQQVRHALERAGHAPASILEAPDGAVALELVASRGHVDLVITGWSMPGMDGPALLKRMKESESLRSIPAIVVAADASRARVIEALQLGARDYVVWPFTPETLARKVAAVAATAVPRQGARRTDTNADAVEIVRERFLSGAGGELAEALVARASICHLQDGHELFKKGEPVESLLLVLKGCVALYDADSGTPLAEVGRGGCVNVRHFLLRIPSHATARAHGAVQLACIERGHLTELSAAHPMLNHLLIRMAAAGSARRAPTQASAMSGQLELIPLSEFIPAIGASAKSGVLRVTGDGRLGLIYFTNGAIEHAQAGAHSGREALFEMLSWRKGDFALDPYEEPTVRSITEGTMSLLMEWARISDETHGG